MGDFSYGVFVMSILVLILLSMESFDPFLLLRHFQQAYAPTTQPSVYQHSKTQEIFNGRPFIVQRSTALSAQFYPYTISLTQAELFTNSDGNAEIDMGYSEVLRRGQNSPHFSCSRQRFIELSTEAGILSLETISEAISTLQLEADSVVWNVRRDPLALNSEKLGCDFLIDGLNGETH